MFLENPISYVVCDSYRKPTQVVEESILRRSSESWLRNSANWSCNFGIKDAPLRGGRSEKAQATV